MGATPFTSRFALGDAVLYDQTPAHVVAVTFLSGKVLYDVRPDDDIYLVHERVDSCDVHPCGIAAQTAQAV